MEKLFSFTHEQFTVDVTKGDLYNDEILLEVPERKLMMRLNSLLEFKKTGMKTLVGMQLKKEGPEEFYIYQLQDMVYMGCISMTREQYDKYGALIKSELRTNNKINKQSSSLV